MKVRCPECRNEQEVGRNTEDRCIVCGNKLYNKEENKLYAPVIKTNIECPTKELKTKNLCEICQKRKAETMLDEVHRVCKKCKWEKIHHKQK